jgi:hypothetical protein
MHVQPRTGHVYYANAALAAVATKQRQPVGDEDEPQIRGCRTAAYRPDVTSRSRPRRIRA